MDSFTIDEQIRELLDKAAAPLMPDDPMNMVGLGSVLLAVKMITQRSRQKLARGEPLDYGERTKEHGND